MATNNGGRSAADFAADPEQFIPDDSSFRTVTNTIEKAIKWLRWASVISFTLAGVASVVVLALLPGLTSEASDRIASSDNSTNMMIFQLLRGSAFAAAVVSILFGLFSLARAAVDQATRFQKRLIAAHFMNHVMVNYNTEIRQGKMNLGDVVAFLKAWSDNVESAFTNVKFGSHKHSTELELIQARAATSQGGVAGKKKNKNNVNETATEHK